MIFILENAPHSHAQYKMNKEKYNYKEYTYQESDKYMPVIAGVASYIIPGLGQMYCNEKQRGSHFLAGSAGGILVLFTGLMIDLPNLVAGNNEFSFGKGLIVGGVLSTCVVQIWSTVDAVRVAKVNNMANRNNTKLGMALLLKPNISINSHQSVGLSFGLRF